MCGCLLCPPTTWDLAHNPESNQQPFGSQAGTPSTEPHQPGHNVVFNTGPIVKAVLTLSSSLLPH